MRPAIRCLAAEDCSEVVADRRIGYRRKANDTVWECTSATQAMCFLKGDCHHPSTWASSGDTDFSGVVKEECYLEYDGSLCRSAVPI